MSERHLDDRYAGLHSPAQVKRLLRDYHALKARQYDGDYDAVILLVDLERAIELAGLTERQREALRKVYKEGKTIEDAGYELGISFQAVSIYANNAVKKIAEVYEKWCWLGEGYDFAEVIV